MAINAKGTVRPLVPAGNYYGVLIGVYDIGTSKAASSAFDERRQVVMSWELHRKKGPVKDNDGKVRIYSAFYGLTLGINKQTKQPSALRKAVEAILGRGLTAEEAKGYDVDTLTDKACRLTIAHSEDGTSDMISGYAPLDPEDDPREFDTVSDSHVYELHPDADFPDFLPEWIQKQVRKSNEWRKVHGDSDPAGRPSRGGGKPKDDDDDDIPF